LLRSKINCCPGLFLQPEKQMRYMKKTKYIRLVLITALLSSCNRAAYHQGTGETAQTNDSTCIFGQDSCSSVFNFDLWYYAFRPFLDYFSIFYPPPLYGGSLVISRSGVLRRGFGRASVKVSS
jgi:hypothetical protein